MTQVTKVNPPAMGPSQGLYSQIVTMPEIGLAFVSGQVSIDRDGTFVGEGDPKAQTTQILRNIGAALEHYGRDWGSLVKLTTYLTSAEHYPAFAAARGEFFAEHFPDGDFPGHTLLVVDALSAPQHLVELEAVIAVDRSVP